ncbi:M13 family metallopeptidase [Nocardioides yefusunii]|uniref:M13 family metallopeptidase n=1 Tax=Nocardioides yefusunii TaxID=2500546 RepID=A0ABW1QZ61_9ACTN|nr:M13-type metalloendopeptidase [Nocardioides yefusunii]
MNLDIRPTDDLFGHVNGTWLDTEEIPSDRSSWGPFVTLADRAEAQVKEIILALADGSTEPVATDPAALEDARKIAALYSTFMDVEAVKAVGTSPLTPWLTKIDALSSTDELWALLGAWERVGGGGLFGSYVDTDSKQSDRYVLNITQSGLGLPDESYYSDEKFAETREKYVAYLAKLFALAGLPDADAQAAEVLAVETRLAQGHWERAETRDVQRTYNLLTRTELDALAPAVGWGTWIDALAASPAAGADAIIAEVVVRQPSYLEHLSGVVAAEPVDYFKAYLRAKVLRSTAAYLTDDFVETNFDFYGRTLSGTPEIRERWKRAVSFVEGAVGEAVGREYVARHFPPRSKELMDELVDNLLKAYRVSIEALDWMTEETKEKAYAKLATFRPKIGYPEKFRDYSALEVVEGDLVACVRNVSAFETDRELAKIGAPVDRDEWFMLPQTVNAYYNPGTNEICFPAGILQRPFFDADADPAENYGGIGAVIGHEIGHGFDDQGAQYDGEGNLNDWWTAADKTAFEAKSKKLVEQYDAFSPRALPEEKVNGQLTVGENIGDLGGLTIGYKAYLLSRGEEEPTDEEKRKVFLNWAYVWRTKRRKELDLQYLTVDPHSPPEFRANIVRNLDEFHDLFGTQPGDGLWLDPEDRVRIW